MDLLYIIALVGLGGVVVGLVVWIAWRVGRDLQWRARHKK
jgi:hypothetical protein